MRALIAALLALAIAAPAFAGQRPKPRIRKGLRCTVLAGQPPGEWCQNERRDAGRCTIDPTTAALCFCAGPTKGWVCK